MLIGYARVSTQDQNPQLQMDALSKAGCKRIFTEKASGASRDRPQLKAAMDFVRAGDTLVVWKFDRLARNLRQLIDTVDRLADSDIGFMSLTEAIDTTNPGGKLVFHIFGALAQFETSIIRERTMAGLQAARAQGKLGGRPKSLSDTDMSVARTLLEDPDIPVQVVAERMGISVPTLYRYFPGGRDGLNTEA